MDNLFDVDYSCLRFGDRGERWIRIEQPKASEEQQEADHLSHRCPARNGPPTSRQVSRTVALPFATNSDLNAVDIGYLEAAEHR